MIYPGQPDYGLHALADLLRSKILSGEMAPGSPFPSDRELIGTYGRGRNTVRQVAAILRSEGLIVVRRGQTSRVRQIYDKQPINLADMESIESRMPTPAERDDRYIDDGVPVFVVKREGKDEPELLPADRWYVPKAKFND